MTITYENTIYEVSENSFKDYTAHMNVPIANGEIVYASCFSKETPDTHVFPDTLTGATFIKCNLMNVFIPEGNTVIDCLQQKYKVQKDARDWFINDDGEPTEVMNRKRWEQDGYSVDPADIPVDNPINVEDMPRYQYDAHFVDNPALGHPLFVGTPDVIETKSVRAEFVVTEEEIDKLQLENIEELEELPNGKKKVKADIELVKVEGEAIMFNKVEQITQV